MATQYIRSQENIWRLYQKTQEKKILHIFFLKKKEFRGGLEKYRLVGLTSVPKRDAIPQLGAGGPWSFGLPPATQWEEISPSNAK